MPLSQTFHQCLNFALYVASPEEKPTALLGITIARIIDASSRLRSTVLRDGAPATTTTVTNFITAEAELESWRLSLNETSRFLVRLGPHLPPQAVFEGEYHTYHDLWAARMWNHYRWARILANQTILDLFDKYPVSAQQLLVSSEDRRERQTMITDLARELLVSSPSHWRHPLLRGKSDDLMEECGVVGSGAAGVLIFLNQAVVASCARGVPPNYWDWTYDVLRCVWADMGMEYAVVLMNVMRDHRKPITP